MPGFFIKVVTNLMADLSREPLITIMAEEHLESPEISIEETDLSIISAVETIFRGSYESSST